MTRLAIALFGGVQVSLDELMLTGAISDKGLALLVYLALEADRPHRRGFLATMLWPNRPEETSLLNLRQTLHRLREQFSPSPNPSPFLLIKPRDLQFNTQCKYWLDAAEFDRSVQKLHNHHLDEMDQCGDCLECLETAIGLYKGDLLEGFSLVDCPDFDWWQLARQEEYHRKALGILDKLYVHYDKVQDYACAGQTAQRAIELEPWSEAAHRQKMRALTLSNQRCAALKQYNTCRDILYEELGIEPSPTTTHLYKTIRAGAYTLADPV